MLSRSDTAQRGVPSLLPALFWALAHGLLLLVFYRPSLLRAVAIAPPELGWALHGSFVVQALSIGFLIFVGSLPLLALGRRYAFGAALWIGAVTAFLYLDSMVYEALGFHVNGLVVSVALQPNGMAETGLAPGEVAALGIGILGAFAADVALGAFVLRRFRSTRPVWPWALGALLLWTGERVASASLIFLGGQPAEQATTLLPLQPRVRMNAQLEALTGRKAVEELRLGAAPQVGVPAGRLDPAALRFERKPDILFVLIESLRADFLDEAIMPKLWARAREGASFTRHYSGAASTQFSLFTLLYSLDAQRRDALIGAGRTPLLFPALKENGYDLRLLAASSVAWMDLRETVFRDVVEGLETDFTGDFHTRDVDMLQRAERILETSPKDRPLFLFVFFAGTHFPYAYPERSAVHAPAWDGTGALQAARRDSLQVRNRAKNAAREVDTKLEELLRTFEAHRGGRPLILATGDHGEELNERGYVGHATDVVTTQLHVPMIVWDETLPPGVHDAPTGHVDVVPTLLSLLGDEHDPALYSDGVPMHRASQDRFVFATAGWVPRYTLIGKDLKVSFRGTSGGLGGVEITDPFDRPLPDGRARFAAKAPELLRRLRGQGEVARPQLFAEE